MDWIKGTLIEFSIPFTIFGNWKLGGGGGGDLVTWNGLGKDHMGEGRDFLVGEDTPKDTMLIKQASFYIYKKSNFTRPHNEIVFGRS